MGAFIRKDSKFWWLWLERKGQRAKRESTKVPVDAPTAAQRKENKALAEALYAARMGDFARQRYDLPADKPSVTFALYRVWYLENISIHKRNQDREASMLRQLGRTFDPLELTAIDLDAGRAWRTARAKEVAPSTVNRELTILKHLMGTATPKYLPRNPLAGLQDLRVPEKEKRLLDPDEEVRLLRDGLLTEEDRAIVLCALDTLQRLSSVAGLKRAQDHGEYLTFLNTKTKGGQVRVSTRLRGALDQVPARGLFYFPSYQLGSDSARRGAVMRMFNEACQRARIPYGSKADGLTFHALRHTGASRMLQRGVDIETVRQIGGWADYKVLMGYLHPAEDAQQRAVELVGNAPVRSRPALSPAGKPRLLDISLRKKRDS